MFEALKKWFPIGGPVYNDPSWYWQGGYKRSEPGRPTQEQLATLAGVHRCCTLFSDSSASQSWGITQSRPTGGQMAIMGSDAAHSLLDWDYVGREQWLFSACLLGNGYAVINRNERGGVGALETVAPWRVTLEWLTPQSLVYRIAEDENVQQEERVIPASNMLHLKFRQTGRHPLLGVSPLIQLEPALAPYFYIRQGLSQVFNWITLPGAYFSSEKSMTEDQRKQLREAYEGRENGRPVVVDGGLEMKDVPVPRLDSLQTLDLSRFGIEEIARAWGVPASMLSQTEGVNYSSAAEQSRQFVTISLQPFARRIESCLSQALLTRSERLSGMRASIDLLPLLLGHGQERSEYYSRLVNSGIMTPNEARNDAGLADIAGGDVLRAPVNAEPIDDWIQPEPEVRDGTAAVVSMLEYLK